MSAPPTYDKEELRKRPNLLTREAQWLIGECSRSTLYRYIDTGKLSRPKKSSQRRCLWNTAEVFSLID